MAKNAGPAKRRATGNVDRQILAELKKMNEMLEIINASLPNGPDMTSIEGRLDDILRALRGAR